LKAYEIPITEATSPDAVRRFQEVQKLLWQNPEMFTNLKRYEKNIVYHRYLSEGPMPTLDEVGQKMNVSREWVRTVDNRVIDIFKKNAHKGEREDE
jgi:DNA-directed RNA polymerase sigma subunit (sigma70/sigma32)